MTNITLSIDDSVYKRMKKHSEVKWSEVARKAIVDRLETLRMAEKLAKKSKLTEADIKPGLRNSLS